MISKAVYLLLSTLFAFAIAQVKTRSTPSLTYFIPTPPSTDNSTYANTDYVQDYHIQIDWDYVNWGNSTLEGSITHEMNVIAFERLPHVGVELRTQTLLFFDLKCD